MFEITPKYIFIGLFMLAIANLKSQSNCSESLQAATSLYNEGVIEEIPNILKPCIDNGFTRNEKIEAYKLIILAYLFDDNQFEAEKTIVEFLKKFPDYELMPSDPIEFVYFFKSYDIIPLFSIGLAVGANITDPLISQAYSTANYNTLSAANAPALGYLAGINLQQYIKGRFFLNLDVLYQSLNFRFTDKLDEFTNIEMQQQYNTISTPISIKYEFTDKKNALFIQAGSGFNYTLKNMVTPSRQYLISGFRDITGANIDITSQKKTLNYFAFAATGLRIKAGKAMVNIKIQYNYGINEITKPENRFDTPELWTRYFYTEDHYKLNTYSLHVNYQVSLFKPAHKFR